jgi:beta-glucosidase
MKYLIKSSILSLLLCFFTETVHARINKDSEESTDVRVKNLLDSMTLDEKIGQMTQVDFGGISRNKNDIIKYFLGSVLNGGSSDPADITPKGWADMYDDLQSYALKTRLKIPIIHGIDAVHGHNNVKGAAIFPHNIGLGCTRNPDLIYKASKIIAAEIAGTGIDWTFAPCIAVPRDERWGRTYEGFGETPELAVMFGPAAINGLQGNKLSDSTSVVTCAKHYVGEGGATDGKNQGNAQMDTATLRALHLPGYIAAIEANVGTVMASYNSWNGVKCHGSKYLLTTLLKEELGFKGFVVSDWDAIDQLPGDYASDIETSINAGIDMVMISTNYVNFFTTLKSLVLAGKIPQSRVDDAVSRILSIKFQLGLFERPYTNRSLTPLLGSAEHREVARECVRQSLVVLKKKDGVLPLAKSGIKIHVSGKSANNLENQCGGWTLGWQNFEGKTTIGTTILQGFKNKLPAANVSYSADGSNADGTDVAIAVIGETPYAEGNGDKADLSLDAQDIEVVRRLKSTGVPVVVIIVSGRPLIINSILSFCDAVIAAWLPGTEGDGVADVLFGDFQPVGRLGHSWPRSMKQIPINVGDPDYNPLFAYDFGITSLSDAPLGSAPQFFSAVTSSGGDTIEISFNKPMADPSLHIENFQIRVNNVINPVVKAVLKNSDTNTIQLLTKNPVKADDAVTFSYLPGTYSAMDKGILEAITNEDVYNILNELKLIVKIPGKIEAENYLFMNGVQTENTSDTGGGKNVGYIETGDWLDFSVDVIEDGIYKVEYRVAGQGAGKILLQTPGVADSKTLATTTFPATGGWQTWTTVKTSVSLKKGKQILRVFFANGQTNINWINFIKDSSTGTKSMNDTGFEIFPNPAGKELKIRSTGFEFNKIEIIDLTGKILFSKKLEYVQNFQIPLTLTNGTYILKISNKSKTVNKQFVVKN